MRNKCNEAESSGLKRIVESFERRSTGEKIGLLMFFAPVVGILTAIAYGVVYIAVVNGDYTGLIVVGTIAYAVTTVLLCRELI